jgi:hypothetical protein
VSGAAQELGTTMPTFRVDTIAIDRAVRDLRPVLFAFGDIVPQFLELDHLAPSTGDPQCAAAFSGFIQQWGSEMVSASEALVTLSNNLLAAANGYVNVEAALSDQDVTVFNVESL